MASSMSGACLCKGVQFRVNGPPDNVFICYCTHCSKNAGATGQISAKFAQENVHVDEGMKLLASYTLTDNLSQSEKQKVFCSRCGCTLWTIPMKHGGTHWIVRTAMIDNGLLSIPYKMEFFASRKVDTASDHVRSFDTMPGY